LKGYNKKVVEGGILTFRHERKGSKRSDKGASPEKMDWDS